MRSIKHVIGWSFRIHKGPQQQNKSQFQRCFVENYKIIQLNVNKSYCLVLKFLHNPCAILPGHELVVCRKICSIQKQY